ncbi:MAG: hypothetical protein LBP81_08395 [Treponema sp.]|nr:hypothetical protein [Treponema sp.]
MSAAEGLAGKSTKFFQTRPKAALIYLAVCAALLILCVTAIMMSVWGNTRTGSGQDLSEAFSPRAVPPEEFFLPDEPDFLPETIPERERRESWTTDDVQPFWQNPLDEGTLVYTELMSKGIDDLMERVP